MRDGSGDVGGRGVVALVVGHDLNQLPHAGVGVGRPEVDADQLTLALGHLLLTPVRAHVWVRWIRFGRRCWLPKSCPGEVVPAGAVPGWTTRRSVAPRVFLLSEQSRAPCMFLLPSIDGGEGETTRRSRSRSDLDGSGRWLCRSGPWLGRSGGCGGATSFPPPNRRSTG